MKKNCVCFDDFINPKENFDKFKNKYLDINDLFHCSYVKYFVLEHINGEICNNYFIIDYDKDLLIDYYFGPFSIYAINYLNNIVCEVI